MIISHKHKFIFIKTRKTAGTSIEIALSKYCGPKDVITRISKKDEETRRKLGYRGPQNRRVSFSKYSGTEWFKFFFQGRRYAFRNHMGAKTISKLIDPEVWNSYFKFCFERNPWDKVVSLYFWDYPTEPRPSLSEFIQAGKPNNVVGGEGGGFDLYAIKGEIVVDRVCFYENIQEEMEYLAKRLNLGEALQLPRAKAGTRNDRRHYQELLTKEDKDKISKVFAREIAYFGYKF